MSVIAGKGSRIQRSRAESPALHVYAQNLDAIPADLSVGFVSKKTEGANTQLRYQF